MITPFIVSELEAARDLVDKFLAEENNLVAIENAALLLSQTLAKKGMVISCGNGGSMCDAMHFAEELSGRFREDRASLAAIAISDTSHITCTANDYGYQHVFSRFIEALGRQGDVLFGISTSGNSENIITACLAAKLKGMKVIALTGKDGGKLGQFADIEIRVPHNGYSDRIQEMHIKIIHILVALVEKAVFAARIQAFPTTQTKTMATKTIKFRP